MRVLVIGGTGFVSGAVVRELLAADHEVTVVTRGQRAVPDEVRAIRIDRKDRAAFKQAFVRELFDGVIDCIGYEPGDAQQDVVVFGGTTQHLVFISTDFTYGTALQPDLPRRLPVTEDAPTDAYSDYGRNKVECEKVLGNEWATRLFPVTILRPPHVLGPGGQLGTGSLYGRDARLIDALRQGVPQILLDGGALLIQPVAAADIGRACVACLGENAAYGKTYNLAGAECVTTLEYYQHVADIVGGKLEIMSLPSSTYVECWPDRRPFAQHRMYDMSRLRGDVGFAPPTSLRSMLGEAVEWLERTGNAQPYESKPGEEELIAALRGHATEVRELLRAN